MDKYSALYIKLDLSAFSIQRSELDPSLFVLKIGTGIDSLIFSLTEQELNTILNLWIFELNSMYFDLRSDEYAAHQDDDTLDDLVHGADAGGKQ